MVLSFIDDNSDKYRSSACWRHSFESISGLGQVNTLSRLLGAGSLGQVDVVAGTGVRQRRDVLGSRSDGHVARVRVAGLSEDNTTLSRYTYN